MSRGKLFIVKFSASLAALYLLFHWLNTEVLKEIVAGSSVWLANAFGAQASVQGSLILADGVSVSIVTACTGLDSIAMLLALVFADDLLSRRNRVLLAVLGSSVLFAWNALRVALSVLSASPEAVHFWLWIVSVLIILALWVSFLKLQGESIITPSASNNESKVP